MRAIMSPRLPTACGSLLAASIICVPLIIISAPLRAGQQSPVTAADYARAERFLAPAVAPLVVGGSVTANWLPNDRFWYRNALATGAEFILVDPVKKTRTRAFDHAKLAATLSAASGTALDAANLPFQSIDPSVDGASVAFNLGTKRWSCDVQGNKCAAVGDAIATFPAIAPGGRGGRGGRGGVAGPTSTDGKPLALSPDGKRGVFIRDWNLWVQDIATRQERQLTTDGVKYFGYATDNAGWSSSDRAIALWSPDSKKVATQQQDEREVGEMYLVSTAVGHPTLRVSKFPLPGDKVMAMLHRVVIDVDSGRTVRLQMEPDYHRATLGDDITVRDYNWSPDGSQLALASVSRDHKQVWLRVADTATGAVRTVFDEKVATQFESRTGWQVLWASNEVIWHSERSNWGQLYLYDLGTGTLKQQITTGDGPVMQIARVDEKTRTLWFGANGREKAQDPYFLHFYRTGLDGKATVSLTPDDGTHTMQLSPSGKYLLDTYSKPDVPPAVALRDAAGKLVMPLERADIAKLLATGWKPPTHDPDDRRRREDRHLRPHVHADEHGPGEKVPDHQQRLPGPTDGKHRQPCLHARTRRSSGACRARLHRRHDRRTRYARPVKGISGRVLRRDGPRQHHSRSDCGHEGAGEKVSVDRSRPHRDLGPLRWWLRDDDGALSVS